jgi:hypothetical protein
MEPDVLNVYIYLVYFTKSKMFWAEMYGANCAIFLKRSFLVPGYVRLFTKS